MTHVAIDIGKDSFDVCVEVGEKRHRGTFKNTGPGRNELHRFLKRISATDVHIFMESTGRYGEMLATWAFEQGWKVTMINPRYVRRFAESEGLYNKTDKIDAGCILNFSLNSNAKKLRLWKPKSPSENELREIYMELLGLEKMISQERNRSKSCIITPVVVQSIQETIQHLKLQKRRLETRALLVIKSDRKLAHDYKILIAMKGIGDKSAIRILARVNFENFTKARQLVGFAGLAPKKWESGKSRKKEIISRVGHADLRSALYFPAITAMRCDPEMAKYRDHLLAQGKHKKVIICAVMAKLLRKAFAMIRDSKAAKEKLAA